MDITLANTFIEIAAAMDEHKTDSGLLGMAASRALTGAR